MADEEDDLFADSDSDDEIVAPKKKAAPPKPAASKKKDDDDDDLFDSDSDDDDAKPPPKKKQEPPKKAMSKRDRLEALAKKKRVDVPSPKEKSSIPKKKKDGSGGKDKGYESGDSYDSGTFERTEDDDNFIDTTGEDQDAINELYADQDFGNDRRPDKEEKKKKRKYGGGGGGGGRRIPEAEEVNEEGVPTNPIMAAVHKMKRVKREKKSVDEVEEEIRTFLGRMEMAAEEDELAVSQRRPAMSKLQFLSKVEEMLTKKDMHRPLLDMDVLSSCRRWIQPLPNGKLGNVTVRQRLLAAVAQMNTGNDNGIAPTDLKRSGIGKVVMILFKHPDETPAMKRMAKNLIEQWSRPIFQKSGNMKDLSMVSREGSGLAAIRRQADYQAQMEAREQQERRARKGEKHANLQSIIASGKKGSDGASSTNRVRVPFSKGFAFSVRPDSKADMPDKSARAGPGGPKDNRSKLAKRMVEKSRTVSKNQRSANISVEGRATKG